MTFEGQITERDVARLARSSRATIADGFHIGLGLFLAGLFLAFVGYLCAVLAFGGLVGLGEAAKREAERPAITDILERR